MIEKFLNILNMIYIIWCQKSVGARVKPGGVYWKRAVPDLHELGIHYCQQLQHRQDFGGGQQLCEGSANQNSQQYMHSLISKWVHNKSAISAIALFHSYMHSTILQSDLLIHHSILLFLPHLKRYLKEILMIWLWLFC